MIAKLKKFFGYLFGAMLSVIFILLFLMLLFGMPVEFAAATWQNLRIDATTLGQVTHSEVIRGSKSNEGSSIEYAYTVDGKSYTSTRWRAGLISNSSQEAGGGRFAKDHPVGAEVLVHYDASNPQYSLLEPGWPKWSVGFSMAVWGILLSGGFERKAPRTRRLLIGYPFTRALTITGFLTIIFSTRTLDNSAMLVTLAIYGASALGALLYLLCQQNDRRTRTPSLTVG